MFSGTNGYRTKPPAGVRLNPLHPLSQGLVGCWLFNEGAGSRANDISGKGNHGTLTNMSTNAQGSGWCGGKFGGELGFDGVNDYTEASHDTSLNPPSLSVFVWVKADTFLNDYNSVVSKEEYSVDVYTRGYTLLIKSNGKLAVYLSKNGYNAYTSYDGTGTYTLSVDKWYHIGFTFDGTTLIGYVDGLIDATVGGGSAIEHSTDVLRIGDCKPHSPREFGGFIDSVNVYNRTLSAAEVKQLYEDPFCNLLRVPVRYAAAAPGGLSIPVAMNYYRRRRVA